MKILITEKQYNFLNEGWDEFVSKWGEHDLGGPLDMDYGAPSYLHRDLNYFENVRKWMETPEYQQYKKDWMEWNKIHIQYREEFTNVFRNKSKKK